MCSTLPPGRPAWRSSTATPNRACGRCSEVRPTAAPSQSAISLHLSVDLSIYLSISFCHTTMLSICRIVLILQSVLIILSICVLDWCWYPLRLVFVFKTSLTCALDLFCSRETAFERCWIDNHVIYDLAMLFHVVFHVCLFVCLFFWHRSKGFSWSHEPGLHLCFPKINTAP